MARGPGRSEPFRKKWKGEEKEASRHPCESRRTIPRLFPLRLGDKGNGGLSDFV